MVVCEGPREHRHARVEVPWLAVLGEAGPTELLDSGDKVVASAQPLDGGGVEVVIASLSGAARAARGRCVFDCPSCHWHLEVRAERLEAIWKALERAGANSISLEGLTNRF